VQPQAEIFLTLDDLDQKGQNIVSSIPEAEIFFNVKMI
jgi:hypothetical protein